MLRHLFILILFLGLNTVLRAENNQEQAEKKEDLSEPYYKLCGEEKMKYPKKCEDILNFINGLDKEKWKAMNPQDKGKNLCKLVFMVKNFPVSDKCSVDSIKNPLIDAFGCDKSKKNKCENIPVTKETKNEVLKYLLTTYAALNKSVPELCGKDEKKKPKKAAEMEFDRCDNLVPYKDDFENAKPQCPAPLIVKDYKCVEVKTPGRMCFALSEYLKIYKVDMSVEDLLQKNLCSYGTAEIEDNKLVDPLTVADLYNAYKLIYVTASGYLKTLWNNLTPAAHNSIKNMQNNPFECLCARMTNMHTYMEPSYMRGKSAEEMTTAIISERERNNSYYATCTDIFYNKEQEDLIRLNPYFLSDGVERVRACLASAVTMYMQSEQVSPENQTNFTAAQSFLFGYAYSSYFTVFASQKDVLKSEILENENACQFSELEEKQIVKFAKTQFENEYTDEERKDQKGREKGQKRIINGVKTAICAGKNYLQIFAKFAEAMQAKKAVTEKAVSQAAPVPAVAPKAEEQKKDPVPTQKPKETVKKTIRERRDENGNIIKDSVTHIEQE